MVSLRERFLTGAFRSIRPLLCALTAPGKALALHRPKLRPLIALRGPLDGLIPRGIRGHRPTRRGGLQVFVFSGEFPTLFDGTYYGPAITFSVIAGLIKSSPNLGFWAGRQPRAKPTAEC